MQQPWPLGYHHLGDFYTLGGALHNKQDLCTRVPGACTVYTVRDWLYQHQGTLQPLLVALVTGKQ